MLFNLLSILSFLLIGGALMIISIPSIIGFILIALAFHLGNKYLPESISQ